ncbi:regulatory protein, tetR family [Actinokineospora alba]|uniref:Regulatory protein, tetR family n=1 Tax=Actinokineospora alba TaxID=504798 RepID=A0A1H0WGX4_9PSEU|nr:TetR/AcrR family transcriptional regulator C-terminal domain-containing protein [Actinokineospora alba]TDP65291.1 TetR family transcriptional regulator [Actinokineospora alba]SDH58987.1 regulatory protein, tetR family [Actinokineospora alba]SDP89546.1 regulatory protein, tetR family [Actinokineospora alba]
MGRPPKFSRERLQAAALEIVDEEGLAALTMRSLAARLGTGPMTLYNHVEHRADLDLLVVDAVTASVRLPEPSDDWRVDVEGIACALWQAARAHPQAIPLILTRRSRSAAVLDVSEALACALARGGRTGADLLVAFRAVIGMVGGFAQAELTSPLAVEPAGDVIERIQAEGSRYPCLAGIAESARGSEPEAEFLGALRALLAGLNAA